jgi:hypothetical protein
VGVGPGHHVLFRHSDVVIPDERVDRARHRYLCWAGVTRGGPDALQCRQNRRGEFVGGQQLGIRAGCWATKFKMSRSGLCSSLYRIWPSAARRQEESGDRVSGRLQSQCHFEPAHTVSKKEHPAVSLGRRCHHEPIWPDTAHKHARAGGRNLSRILDRNPFDIGGERLGKRDIKGRSTNIRKYM